MPKDIYSRFVCESINICANPKCNQQTDNPKYCSLSCVSTHRGMLNDQRRRATYDLNPKTCIRVGCDNIIRFESRNFAIYCSHSCGAVVNNIGRIRKPVTEEFREKMRQINLERNANKTVDPQICQICNRTFICKKSRKTCSSKCYSSIQSLDRKELIKTGKVSIGFNRRAAKSSIDIGGKIRNFRSSWELAFWLCNQDLEYETLRIPYQILESNHAYIADFYDPISRIIYEIKPKEIWPTQIEKMDAVLDWCAKNEMVLIWVNEDNIFNWVDENKFKDLKPDLFKKFYKMRLKLLKLEQ
jgi:hypothetical protein